MRIPIKVKMNDKLEDAILWIGEAPPSCRHGRDRKRKSRRYKHQKEEEKWAGRAGGG